MEQPSKEASDNNNDITISDDEMRLSKKRADRLKEIQEQFDPGDDSDLARIIAQINENNKK